jgi:cathepsin X
VCENCAPGNDEKHAFWPGKCVYQKPTIVAWVVAYHRVPAEMMRSEIFEHGPISCGIAATDKMVKYKGGVFEESPTPPMINHEISLAGWGKSAGGDNGDVDYWVGRNSWGTYWGEYGWFRIRMHKNNNLVETDCSAGVPSLKPPKESKENVEIVV